MNYKEEKEKGNEYREKYVSSIEKMIKELQKSADDRRALHFEEMIKNPDEYRAELKQTLGWPLTDYDSEIPDAVMELVHSEESVHIYRVLIELPIGITFYGMFFKHPGRKGLPLVIAQHGASGTPEICSGIWDVEENPYNDMVMRTFRRGVNVFAPQLLLWNCGTHINLLEAERYNRADIDSKLKQLGSSIAAVEIYGIMKSIDFLSSLDCTDKNRIGMIGMSYGGFYTLFTSALDTRIKAAITCCQFNNRYEHSWVDWTWFNSANKFLDAEIACMIYPRKLFVLVGKNDCMFDSNAAKKEFVRIKEMIDDSKFEFCIFDGGHEFDKNDEWLDKLVNSIWN